MRVCIVSMGFLLVVGALGCDSAGRDEVISEVASKGTRVTDAGLVHLKGLTRLQVLDVSSTQVTDGGVQKLQQSLPNCGIKH